MEDAEILIREEGSPKVAQLCNVRPLSIRLEGLERHRVLRWLNCRTRPPDFRVPNTATSPRSPDESFNRFLRIFFFLILSLGVIKILYELSLIDNPPSSNSIIPNYSPLSNFYAPGKMWLIYPFDWSRIMLLVMLAVVAVAAPIVKKKMKNMDFTPPRKEEVKIIPGLIQEV